MPVSVPKYVGQIPVYYNQKYPHYREYIDMTSRPLYVFGYGLSYTTFKYENLSISKEDNEKVIISFDITNTGKRDGEEVPQLYIHHNVSSTVQPMIQLKGFTRLMIKSGEIKRVVFTLDYDDFTIINKEMKRILEKGTIEIMIGTSSDNFVLKGSLNF